MPRDESFLIAEGRAEAASRRGTAPRTSRAVVSTARSSPEFRGALETDDGATILFHWEGLARLTESGMRQLVGMAQHTSDDERYRWLNDRVLPSRARSGRVRPVRGSTWCSK